MARDVPCERLRRSRAKRAFKASLIEAPRTPQAIAALRVEHEDRVGGFAWTAEYRPRRAYAGVAEFSVYVARGARGQGVGWLAISALISEAESRGCTRLVSRVFPRMSMGDGRASPDASGGTCRTSV